MKTFIKKPHIIFFTAIPILLLIGNLSCDAVMDINIHDTYVIITYMSLALLTSLLFGIIGAGYWLMYKTDITLLKRLTRIHIILTFGGALTIWGITQYYRKEMR